MWSLLLTSLFRCKYLVKPSCTYSVYPDPQSRYLLPFPSPQKQSHSPPNLPISNLPHLRDCSRLFPVLNPSPAVPYALDSSAIVSAKYGQGNHTQTQEPPKHSHVTAVIPKQAVGAHKMHVMQAVQPVGGYCDGQSSNSSVGR